MLQGALVRVRGATCVRRQGECGQLRRKWAAKCGTTVAVQGATCVLPRFQYEGGHSDMLHTAYLQLFLTEGFCVGLSVRAGARGGLGPSVPTPSAWVFCVRRASIVLPMDYSDTVTMKGAARRDSFHDLRISVSWIDPERIRHLARKGKARLVEGE